MKKKAPSEPIKKIGVLRANAVGDYIVALPALDALRRSYPHAEIVLLGRHWHSAFLANRPGPVDRAVTVPYIRGIYEPPGEGREDAAEIEAFFRTMVRERFDIVFQMHGGGRHSNPFVSRLGARLTVGARAADAPPLDRWIPYRAYQHESLRLLEIASLAGTDAVNLETRLAVIPSDVEEADRLVPDDGRPVVLINPGSRDPRRRWPARNFAALADLFSNIGARIVINGDAGDAETVRDAVSSMRTPGESVCEVLSLGGLAGLLSRARLLITNDSGPFHLASAIGTPCVGIFWCGNVLTYGPTRCRKTAVHISWRLTCPACGVHCMQPGCGHQESFVADIAGGEVAASALELYRQEVRRS